MNWIIIRTIQSRPLFRLCTRNNILCMSSTTHGSRGGVNLSSDLRVSKLFEKNVPITGADWNNIRLNFLKSPTINASNVDELIMDFCERNRNALDNALSYVEFLHDNNGSATERLQLKVIQLYMKLICEGPVSEEIQAKTIQLCENIINRSDKVKQVVAINVFIAISSTTAWKRCIDLIDKYDIKCSTSTVPTFSLLAANAFWEDEPSIGWHLLNKIVERDLVPQCISFLAYWNYCSLYQDDKFIERFEKMLEFISVNDVLVSRQVLDGMQNAIDGIELKQTEIDFRGNCSMCRQALDEVRLSSIEFQMLKKEFEKTIFNKENILAHSSQSELIRFKQHVNKKRNYDCIIDGLNVALTVKDNYLEQAKSLARVVEYFVQRKKRILVIGRKHINTWPEHQMNYIKMNATVFLTADKSDDDPYLLYAAFISGENTDFLSRDQMRNYSQQLSSAGQHLFKRWQKQHQIHFVVNENDKIPFRIHRPFRYKHYCHKNERLQWHVPFVEMPAEKLGRYWENDVKWACFTFEK